MLPAQRRRVLQQAVINGLPMAVQCFRGPLQEPYSIKQWTSQQDKFRINLVHQMPRLNTSLPICRDLHLKSVRPAFSAFLGQN